MGNEPCSKHMQTTKTSNKKYKNRTAWIFNNTDCTNLI